MVFDKLVGRVILWSGTFTDSEGVGITYILFGDPGREVVAIKEGEEPQLLEDAEAALQDIVSEGFESAKNLMELAQISKYAPYESWVVEKFQHPTSVEEVLEHPETSEAGAPDPAGSVATNEVVKVSHDSK